MVKCRCETLWTCVVRRNFIPLAFDKPEAGCEREILTKNKVTMSKMYQVKPKWF